MILKKKKKLIDLYIIVYIFYDFICYNLYKLKVVLLLENNNVL